MRRWLLALIVVCGIAQIPGVAEWVMAGVQLPPVEIWVDEAPRHDWYEKEGHPL